MVIFATIRIYFMFSNLLIIGMFAFPGGHTDYNEDPYTTVLRELVEECGVTGENPVLIDVRGKPQRDPRYHMVSFFFLVDVKEGGDKVVAGDDADTADWYFLDSVIR